jgi:hypothetical protein
MGRATAKKEKEEGGRLPRAGPPQLETIGRAEASNHFGFNVCHWCPDVFSEMVAVRLRGSWCCGGGWGSHEFHSEMLMATLYDFSPARDGEAKSHNNASSQKEGILKNSF